MKLRNLDPDDLPTVRELLASSELPIDDIDDPSITFIGAFEDSMRTRRTSRRSATSIRCGC